MADVQADLLGAFSCDRLSRDRANLHLIKGFKCHDNDTLTDYIRNRAWDDDSRNRRAVYLIKKDGVPVFFFSLQCGSMYEPYKEEELERSFANFKELEPYVQEIRDLTNGDDIANHIFQLLDAGILPKDKFKTLMENYHNSVLARNIMQDEKEDPANKLKRVYKNIPVVELVHFCANEKAKNFAWDANAIHRKLGETVFFKFISPIVEEVSQKVGCTHLFLFASDDTQEEHLIRYYIGQMNFKRDDKLIPKKTDFSLFCTALCQKTAGMEKRRLEFFEDFFPDTQAEDFI